MVGSSVDDHGLKFASLSSDVELPFYTSLASHKINHDKLDDSARQLLGLYQIRPGDAPESSCRLEIHGNSLTLDSAEGFIKNVNTIEEYRGLDRTEVITRCARTIWDGINDGTIFSCPSLLSSFTMICFADLKKYKFTYLFAFPVLHCDSPWRIANDPKSGSSSRNVLSSRESSSLVDTVQSWRYASDSRQHGFFLVKKRRHGIASTTTSSQETRPSLESRASNRSTSDDHQDIIWEVGALSQYEDGFFKNTSEEDQYIAFADPSTYSDYPGWMLRNLLALVFYRWNRRAVQILCYRDTHARRDDARSFSLLLETNTPVATGIPSADIPDQKPMPKITGWERNNSGKVVNKIANLGEYMDPLRLADQAVDLNLKLMKWRIAPNLNLEKIKETSCLLLGAGTLGTHVSRNLMGWGVRKITFVDNASVSFSNPVRQPLFTYQDCLAGGAKKASRAAEALKEIYPGVNAEGRVFSVPMVGHPITNEAKVKQDYDMLQKAIEEHDAIFLLMDTRESRWLPTLMAKAAGKIVMNAALGFDSFLVMRHGTTNTHDIEQELGCYFCNDVVAPLDSMSARTLDQQCTVTRPGVSAIASAMLVEIFVSLLQHPEGPLAPAPIVAKDTQSEQILGIVPHQIRGFLAEFRNVIVSGKSYDCCSACSRGMVKLYSEEGWSFVCKALSETGYVERVSGLAEVQRAAEKAIAEMEGIEDDFPDFEDVQDI